jgi:peptide deformylase
MQLPVYAYGHPVLKKVTENITKEEFAEMGTLIEDMFTTMYNTIGVGLAAPQIGKSIRLFVVDTIQIEKEADIEKGIKKVFINAQKLEETGKLWSYDEGCLSFPDINGSVERLSIVKIKYLDENFEEHIDTFDGFNARVILHEYDHLDGILFVEKMKPLKRRLINKRLEKIRTGDIDPPYPMRFYRRK